MAEGKNIFSSVGVTPVQAVVVVGALWGGYKVAQKFGLVDSPDKQKETALLSAEYLSPSYVKMLEQQKKKFYSWTNATTPKDIAKRIKESKGFFDDKEDKLWGALKRIQYKSQAGVVSYWFTQTYGLDITEYLNGFQSKAEMARIFDYFEKLPSGIV